MKKSLVSLMIIGCIIFEFTTNYAPQMKNTRIPQQKMQPKRVENILLDKNVRFDFKFVFQNGKSENFYLITASDNYEFEINQQDKSKHNSR